MAQTEKSVMLRLRNNESRIADPNDPTQHASWQTTLKTPVTLEEGDQVKIHTCILDTSAESVIQLDDPDGVDIEIGVMRYITFYQNYESGANGTTKVISIKPTIVAPPADVGKNQIPDVKRYFACLEKGSIANAYYVNFVQIMPLHQGLDECGDCTLKFGYTSGLTNLTKTFVLQIPPFHPVSHENGIVLRVAALVVGNNGWDDFFPLDDDKHYTDHKLKRPSNAADKKISPTFTSIFYSAEVPAGNLVSEPFVEQMDFNIPKGRYTPAEICTKINDQLSNLEFYGPSINEPSLDQLVPPQTPQFCVNNPFLGTVRQMTNFAAQANGGPYNLVFYPEVDDRADDKGDLVENVSKVMRIDAAALAANVSHNGNGAVPNNRDDLFIGAEQVDLNFDPILKKLNFSIMHFPIYVGYQVNSTPAVPGVIYNADGKLATTYGGAAITFLNPPEFWQKQLGFSTIEIPVQAQTTPFNDGPGGVGGDTVYPTKVGTSVGVNVTDIFRGLDIPVAKTDRFFAPEAIPTAAIESSLTTGIIANREFDTSAKDEGYFLIEVGFKFPQMMIGGQFGDNLTNNNIQSVVGKYFTGDNNFLQDTGAGSIVYEHVGEPELLTDLNVRVLLPDGTLPSNTELGPKNSIFLEIIKTENQTPPTPPAPEKKK